MEHKEGFSFTYSAAQQQEIEAIRKKYLPREEDKMERLRRLDMSAVQKAQAVSLVFGVIGILLLGLGMSIIMSDLGAPLGGLAMPLGICIGVVGGIIAGFAYPVYSFILGRERKRLAPEIIRLTDELLK